MNAKYELRTYHQGSNAPLAVYGLLSMHQSIIIICCALVLLSTANAATLPQRNMVALTYDQGAPQIRFAAAEIRRTLAAKGIQSVEGNLAGTSKPSRFTRIILVSDADQTHRIAKALGVAPPQNTARQSYAIRRKNTGSQTDYMVFGTDAVGAMYGGLDLAETIRLGALTDVKDIEQTPYIARRGIKFNIPLDARTPSYSDNSDAAQQNIPEMWSFEFWRELLDEMARHRYNVLSLWSLHPFPSLVKVPEYPDIALDDVKRTTLKMDDTFSHTGRDMVRPEMLQNLETVKKISIDEKIKFWRDVMQYADDRGIEVYLFTWNIFTFGTEGKYGITPAQDNSTTIDYFRKSVRETILTYPLLAGFGITAGEQMQNRRDKISKEKWLWETYGEGIRDAKKLQPNRNVRLIHRYHQTGQAEILTEWKDYPDTLDLSFKYAIAHMYSTPAPPFFKSVLPQLPANLRVWMTIRNDDIYSFRWGDPEFARAFIRHLPGAEKMAGFYMGPDGYIWGREFLSTEPETPRELVMKKQWYSFMLWGRLSYDPSLPDSLFERTLAKRFPEVPSAKLYQASATASKIIPQITRFFWGDIDLKWFPEACLSHPKHKGFYTVRHFIEGATMPESGILNIIEYREKIHNKQNLRGLTPPQVADALNVHAQTTLQLVSDMRPKQKANKELRLLLGDLEAMAHLGNYYAEKILGATDLALFDLTGKAEQKETGVKHLEAALDHWKRYAAAYSRQYKPQLLNRVGYVDLSGLTAKVEQDVEIARNWQQGTVTK